MQYHDKLDRMKESEDKNKVDMKNKSKIEKHT